jgi:TolA-binding protein
MKANRVWFWVIAIVGAVVLTGCGPSMVTKYDVAKNLAEKGDPAAAIETYKEFIAQNPDSTLVPYAMYNIALLHKEMNDDAGAMAAYEKLIEQFPAKDPAQWAKANLREMKKE